MKVARLVNTGSGLCVTAGVGKKNEDTDVFVTEPVLHEYIRHGFISALANWDDVASAVRRTGQDTGNRKVPAVLGNQWGLPGVWPISTLMSQVRFKLPFQNYLVN